MSRPLYAILDVETTGSAINKSKITEIAIFLHDGNKVINTYNTLVNPEINIPPFIQQFTGITNEMVSGAPTFPQIAKDIFKFTEGAILVAHNSSFDYGMLKSEYRSLGFNFHRNTLCTVRMSKKRFPGMPSYSLGKLCKNLGIEIKDRHRAGGDAEATVRLFEMILNEGDKSFGDDELRIDAFNIKLHPNVNKASIESLPDETGVYYFHDKAGEVIYVGKSIEIRKRVLSHFSGKGSRNHLELKNEVRDITFEVTGSELIALLLEAHEIGRLQPRYNSMMKHRNYTWGIFTEIADDGYRRFAVKKLKPDSKPIALARGKLSGEQMLHRLVKEFVLCPKLCGLDKSASTCFQHQLNKCLGACCGAESAAQYNLRAQLAIDRFIYSAESFAIVDKGKSEKEKSVVLVENSALIGYGFIPVESFDPHPDGIRSWMRSITDNKHIVRIIRSYLKENRVEKILRFE